MTDFAQSVVARIEGLTDTTPRNLRRLFKAIRQEARALPPDDELGATLRGHFGRMRRFERRDHVAMLRLCYFECLPKDRRGQVRKDSVRRLADPDA